MIAAYPVNGYIPGLIFGPRNATARTISNSGNSPIWLTDQPSNNGYALGPGSSISWDAGKALYAYTSAGVTGQIAVLNNAGPIFDAAALAASLAPSLAGAPSAASTYGDGADGNVTIGAATTLTRDMAYATLTVAAGVTLKTAGWKVRCSVTLDNNGNITNDGPQGIGDTGAMVAGAPAGSLGGGGLGGHYGAAPNNLNGTAPVAATVIGGSGGASNGTSGAPNVGTGAGGVGATGTALVGAITLANLATATMSGGAGGGGTGMTGQLFNGGGGGAGAIAIFAQTLNNNGVIRAQGGYSSGTLTFGGGGGGTILLVSTYRTGAAATAPTQCLAYSCGAAGTVIELTL